MIRLVLLSSDLRDGGAQRQLVTLARNLDSRCFQVTVVAFRAGGPLLRELEEASVKTVILGKRGRWDVLPFFYRLITQLRSLHPDVLHGYKEAPNTLCILMKPFLPATKMVWGIRVSSMEMDRGREVRVLSRVERSLSRFPDLIVANSKAGLDHILENGYPGERAIAISNGINTERFRPDDKARREVRAEWGVLETELMIGMVARLAPKKDYPTFLRAAALAARGREHLRFACIGRVKEGYLRELQVLASRLGIGDRVIWAGPRDDTERVYNALDILTLSSAYGEGFPNVVGEAMASEVPCLVTDVGDSALVVGQTGVVVPPGDPQALADGMKGLISEGPVALKHRGRAARARIQEEFSIETLVRTTEGHLLALAGRQSHRVDPSPPDQGGPPDTSQ